MSIETWRNSNGDLVIGQDGNCVVLTQDDLAIIGAQVWNAAIDEAADLVHKHYDPSEPWIRSKDIRALKKKI